MENDKEIFNILAAMYEGINKKRLKYDDFIAILPKLNTVRKHIPVGGIELILVIDELMDFREKNLLDQINDETMDLVKKLYFAQTIFDSLGKFPVSSIIKHLLIPYQKNICKKEKETGKHMNDFEVLFSYLGEIIAKDNVWQQEILRKYNSSLYELLMHFYLCKDRVSEINNVELASAILNMFSVFYFKQDEYDNDYSFLDEFVDNAIFNKREFIEYCNQEGIKVFFLNKEDYNNTYRGIIKYIDESYKIRKKGK